MRKTVLHPDFKQRGLHNNFGLIFVRKRVNGEEKFDIGNREMEKYLSHFDLYKAIM